MSLIRRHFGIRFEYLRPWHHHGASTTENFTLTNEYSNTEKQTLACLSLENVSVTLRPVDFYEILRIDKRNIKAFFFQALLNWRKKLLTSSCPLTPISKQESKDPLHSRSRFHDMNHITKIDSHFSIQNPTLILQAFFNAVNFNRF